MNWLPILLELLGSIVYLYIRLITTNPLIIGGTLATLIFMIQKHHTGSFNPALDTAQIFAGTSNKWKFIKHLSVQLGGALVAGVLYRWAAIP